MVLKVDSLAVVKRKRGYSKEFRAHGNSGKNYLLDGIPAGFWADIRKQATADGFSLRGLILGLLRDWLARRQREDADLANRWTRNTGNDK